MTGVLVATSVTAQTRVLPRTGAKPLVMTGMALGVIAMIVFTRLTPGGAYATHVLPGLLVIGLGMGCIFAPAIGTATLGVEVRETGVASAMVNTSQQIGGSVGLALLSTVSASAVADYARTHVGQPGLAGAASVHGYTTGFWWAAGMFATGLLLALLILPWKAETRECTLRTAITRGIAYALHLEAAATAARPTPCARAADLRCERAARLTEADRPIEVTPQLPAPRLEGAVDPPLTERGAGARSAPGVRRARRVGARRCRGRRWLSPPVHVDRRRSGGRRSHERPR